MLSLRRVYRSPLINVCRSFCEPTKKKSSSSILNMFQYSKSETDELNTVLSHIQKYNIVDEHFEFLSKYIETSTTISSHYPVMKDKLLENTEGWGTKEWNLLLANCWKSSHIFPYAESVYRIVKAMRSALIPIQDHSFLHEESLLLNQIRSINPDEVNKLSQRQFNYLAIKLISQGNLKSLISILKSNLTGTDIWGKNTKIYNERVQPELLTLLNSVIASNGECIGSLPLFYKEFPQHITNYSENVSSIYNLDQSSQTILSNLYKQNNSSE